MTATTGTRCGVAAGTRRRRLDSVVEITDRGKSAKMSAHAVRHTSQCAETAAPWRGFAIMKLTSDRRAHAVCADQHGSRVGGSILEPQRDASGFGAERHRIAPNFKASSPIAVRSAPCNSDRSATTAGEPIGGMKRLMSRPFRRLISTPVAATAPVTTTAATPSSRSAESALGASSRPKPSSRGLDARSWMRTCQPARRRRRRRPTLRFLRRQSTPSADQERSCSAILGAPSSSRN